MKSYLWHTLGEERNEETGAVRITWVMQVQGGCIFRSLVHHFGTPSLTSVFVPGETLAGVFGGKAEATNV